MLTLINTNTMLPAIAPVGLDYIATATRQAGIETEVLDLCLADEPAAALQEYFATHNPELVGLSFRNVDDCFWPSCEWFVPNITKTVEEIKKLCDAPIVIGGVGFSIFAEQIIEHTGADFGIRGDGELAAIALYRQLQANRLFEQVDGLVWRGNGRIVSNRPAWPRRYQTRPPG